MRNTGMLTSWGLSIAEGLEEHCKLIKEYLRRSDAEIKRYQAL